MLLSNSHQFIYIKTVKTASTSVELFLQPFCCPPDHDCVERTDPVVSEHGIVGGRMADASNRFEFYNHMPASQIKLKLDEATWETSIKVANIRNPFDRAVSRFHHFEMPLKDYPDATPSEIVERFRNWIQTNPQFYASLADSLCIDGKSAVDHYIRFEHLASDLKSLGQKLDLPLHDNSTLANFKSGMRPQAIPLVEYFDERATEALIANAGRDFKLFGYDLEVPQLSSR